MAEIKPVDRLAIEERNMKKNTFWEVLLRILIAAATAAITAIGTTSCMGHGPF